MNSSPGNELKKKNRNSIYRLIHQRGSVSKQNIVTELGLSLPTVTQNLVELMAQGLVCEQGSIGNTGGRRAKAYTIKPEARLAVGVDINKQHFSAVLVDLQGNILSHVREYLEFENNDTYLQRVGSVVNQLIQEYNVAPQKVLGVGLALQGITTADNAQVSYGEILGITGARLEQLGRYISYPKALFHDSDMAAYAEAWCSRSKGRAVYLSLSTNLGGAVMCDSGIQTGENYGLGRLEHMTIIPDGKRCYCGQFGCADAYCSTLVLTEATADGRLSSFFRQLEGGDKKCVGIWEEYLNKLSIVFNNACMIFDCDVVLGGYLGEYLEPYMEDIKRHTYRRNSFDQNRDYLNLGQVRLEPVALGAALQYVEQFISSI